MELAKKRMDWGDIILLEGLIGINKTFQGLISNFSKKKLHESNYNITQFALLS